MTTTLVTWGATYTNANGVAIGTGKIHCASAPTTVPGTNTMTDKWYSEWTLGFVGVGTTTPTTVPLTFRTATWSL